MELHTRVAKRMTTAILVTSFVYAFVNSISSVLINEVVETFALKGASQGLMSSMLSFGLMLALLVNPLFQGRISKITMIVLSCLLQAAMLLLSGGAPNFLVFVSAIMLMGAGCGWLDGYINSTIIDTHPTDSPKYLGLVHGIFGIGSLIAPLAMQWLLSRVSWRSVHSVIAALVLIAMLLVILARRGSKATGMFDKDEEERLSLKQVGSYLKRGRNLLLLGCGAMTAMVQTGIVCWIARYMLLAHNREALGATCLTIFWIAATINRFIAPRLKVRPLVLIMGGGLAAAVFLGVGILSNQAIVMCLCMGVLGLATGHFMPMVVAECANGYAGNTTLTTSVVMFVMGVSRVIIPILMAALTDAISVRVGMSLPILAGVLVAVFSFGALKMKPDTAGKR